MPVKRRMRARNRFQQAQTFIMDGAGMAKIGAHPCGRIDLLWIVNANVARGSFVLRLPREHVVVAALPVVKKSADRTEELHRRAETLFGGVCKKCFIGWP